MKKIILFCFIALKAWSINAQPYVLIPDANFRAYLNGTIPGAMNGNSLNITSTLVTTAQTLNISVSGISNLTGIQYFSSLSYLNCVSNSLTTLPTLPNSLQSLVCDLNPLTNLPTLPNSLQYISCYNNSLTAFPTLPNSITYLDCHSNSLTALPVLPNSLTYVDCHFNHLTSLPPLPTSIQTLMCSNNSLTSLPALPNSLQVLYCFQNSITTLPALSNSLREFFCQFNSLTALPILPNSLQFLVCSNNSITCFPFFPSSIIAIVLSPNSHTCLPNYVLPAMAGYTTTPLCLGNCDTGINQMISNNSLLQVYPNPTNLQFTIETMNLEKQTAKLFDLNGRLLFSLELTSKTTIDATSLNSGVYNLSIKTGGNIINKKLVVVR